VTWNPDQAKFICNALAPAEIVRVVVDEDRRSMEVVVPDDQLSLAIGKRGQNVRLASKLSGWNLDVVSETNYNRAFKDAYDSLLNVEGVGEKTALNLYQSGFRSAKEVAEANVSDLIETRDIGEEKAKKIIESAANYLESKAEEEGAEGPKAEEETTEEKSEEPKEKEGAVEEKTDGEE
jgi:N utilization substance protein A